jgi:TPR repeat protein
MRIWFILLLTTSFAADDGSELRVQELGCAAGSATACMRAGEMLTYGLDGVEEDAARAVTHYERACDLGVAHACEEAVMDLPRVQPIDEARRRRLAERGCELGDGDACASLAGILGYGIGAPADATQARAALKRACELGHPNGCYDLADLCMRGLGGPVDVPEAQAALRKACDVGSTGSCRAYAAALDAKPPTDAKAWQAVLRTMMNGCAAGDESGCAAAGRVLAGTRAGPADPKAAKEYLAFACAEGEQDACDKP